ncbi:SapC family protein [Halomonas lysinitropha]|uniref:SapC n=1 Tax=Halomonas lysinitropha TaxID=2607506 RepID=A0A5K1I0C5_9GAMM|nr:SapC family protein [Halomonas lysinitropha]VVZ95274.1 SapC [Halomonas lysinitropha]
MSWILLSRTTHQGQGYSSRTGYQHTAHRSATPVLLAELPRLLPHYVLGFVWENESFIPIAMLGLAERENLYLHPDGRWLGSYVPSSLRGYPFTLARRDQEQVLAIEQDHLCEVGGEPLFDDQNQLAPKVQQTLDFLVQCEKNRQLTQQSVDALAQVDVIESWPLKVEREEGQEPVTVKGLYRISEHALNALEPETYAKLRGGPMALAYAQLFSMSQLSQLTERANFHAKRGEGKMPEDLDSLFGEGDEDFELYFDQ